MGSSNNHMYDIHIKQGTFNRLLKSKGLKVIDCHELLVSRYGVELKYKSFNNLINNRVNWKLVYATIVADFLEIKISELFHPIKNKKYVPSHTLELIIDDVSDKPNRTDVKFSRVYRNLSKATKLKMLYQYNCQICCSSIQINESEKYAESHHMQQLGHPHNGVDDWNNMIVVCPNHHIMFDKGAIAIHPETLELYGFNKNRVVRISNIKTMFKTENHTIRKEYLQYHWENIFLPNIHNKINRKFKNKKFIIKRSSIHGV
jgi:pimeloyl-CoA synthetase